MNYKDSANAQIQDRRSIFPVPVAPGGMVHDYVPFYFHPRSPMLYVISKKKDRYPEGQAPIIHLVSTVQDVYPNRPCVFTDGHAIMAISEYFTELSDLAKVDWPVMQSMYWYDTEKDPDRKRRRQAEFLVQHHLPWELVAEVAVFNGLVQKQVVKMLESAEHRPAVLVKPEWYY